MTEYEMDAWVFTWVDGAKVECQIRGLPEPGGTMYELSCQGEIIKRDASRISKDCDSLQ